MKNILIIICSKNPTINLYNNINNINIIQKNDKNKYKIICVDSDSENTETYQKIKNNFKEIEIFFIKNKNYEYGAYKYGFEKYPYFDIYFCIQDTLIINNYINIDTINDNNVYTYKKYCGWSGVTWVKHKADRFINNYNLNINDYTNKNFNIAQHNSFICNKYILNNIFKIYYLPPNDKVDSMIYERLFGLYFELKNITVHELNNSTIKINGNRK